jgi:hypothetical protein
LAAHRAALDTLLVHDTNDKEPGAGMGDGAGLSINEAG